MNILNKTNITLILTYMHLSNPVLKIALCSISWTGEVILIHFYHQLLSQCFTFDTINFFLFWEGFSRKLVLHLHNCFFACVWQNQFKYVLQFPLEVHPMETVKHIWFLKCSDSMQIDAHIFLPSIPNQKWLMPHF